MFYFTLLYWLVYQCIFLPRIIENHSLKNIQRMQICVSWRKKSKQLGNHFFFCNKVTFCSELQYYKTCISYLGIPQFAIYNNCNYFINDTYNFVYCNATYTYMRLFRYWHRPPVWLWSSGNHVIGLIFLSLDKNKVMLACVPWLED